MKYKLIIENVSSAYILDSEQNRIVALCTTKRPDLGFKALEEMVALANKGEQKPVTRDSMHSPALCPACHTDKICQGLDDGHYRYYTGMKYCLECGQKLDWD